MNPGDLEHAAFTIAGETKRLLLGLELHAHSFPGVIPGHRLGAATFWCDRRGAALFFPATDAAPSHVEWAAATFDQSRTPSPTHGE